MAREGVGVMGWGLVIPSYGKFEKSSWRCPRSTSKISISQGSRIEVSDEKRGGGGGGGNDEGCGVLFGDPPEKFFFFFFLPSYVLYILACRISEGDVYTCVSVPAEEFRRV